MRKRGKGHVRKAGHLPRSLAIFMALDVRPHCRTRDHSTMCRFFAILAATIVQAQHQLNSNPMQAIQLITLPQKPRIALISHSNVNRSIAYFRFLRWPEVGSPVSLASLKTATRSCKYSTVGWPRTLSSCRLLSESRACSEILQAIWSYVETDLIRIVMSWDREI